jgi:Tfp pilus assembly protein PilV
MLIELMVAAVIVLVALLGFVTSMNEASHANAVGHRRTVESHLRTALIDRMAVMPRDQIDSMVASFGGNSSTPTDTEWVVDSCYDVDAQQLTTNASQTTTFVCGDDAKYRSWIRIDPGGNRTWMVRTYTERTDAGCTQENRYASMYCVAADLLLTD